MNYLSFAVNLINCIASFLKNELKKTNKVILIIFLSKNVNHDDSFEIMRGS